MAITREQLNNLTKLGTPKTWLQVEEIRGQISFKSVPKASWLGHLWYCLFGKKETLKIATIAKQLNTLCEGQTPTHFTLEDALTLGTLRVHLSTRCSTDLSNVKLLTQAIIEQFLQPQRALAEDRRSLRRQLTTSQEESERLKPFQQLFQSLKDPNQTASLLENFSTIDTDLLFFIYTQFRNPPEHLKTLIFSQLQDRFHEITQHKGFDDFTAEDLYTLVYSTRLIVTSEDQLLAFLHSWTQKKQMKLENPVLHGKNFYDTLHFNQLKTLPEGLHIPKPYDTIWDQAKETKKNRIQTNAKPPKFYTIHAPHKLPFSWSYNNQTFTLKIPPKRCGDLIDREVRTPVYHENQTFSFRIVMPKGQGKIYFEFTDFDPSLILNQFEFRFAPNGGSITSKTFGETLQFQSTDGTKIVEIAELSHQFEECLKQNRDAAATLTIKLT
ncbi:MAG: hypothetical protein KDK65_01825 [Chlamydiia bacterium]|nr:hypothetical protein [Chlamydiia bacterium]